jgi:hypothetical protein
MKKALLIGCGSKFGLDLLKILLDQDWEIYSISGSLIDISNNRLHQKVINWGTTNVTELEKFLISCSTLDMIFFNQNSSSLSSDYFTKNYYNTIELWKQEKTWSQSYFVSCILPFHIIHSLKDKCNTNTKIAWMLSEYIYQHCDTRYPDYIGNKYQNYLIMKNFSRNHESSFFGINPGNLAETNTKTNIVNLISFIEQTPKNLLNGIVINFDTTIDTNFQIFNT